MKRLRRQIATANAILQRAHHVSEGDDNAWTVSTELLLLQIYGEGSPPLKGMKSATPRIALSDFKDARAMSEHRRETLQNRVKLLKSLTDALERDAIAESDRTAASDKNDESLEDARRIILIWSGKTSHKIALFQYGWWPRVVPGVVPWISTEDIAKGDRWFPELMSQLGKSTTCVISITPENHKAPWVYYEAGVIAAKQENGKICTVLFGVTTSNIKDTPMDQFQATEAVNDDMWRLVKSINRRLAEGAHEEQPLRALFDRYWPELKDHIDESLSNSVVSRETTETIHLLSQYNLSDEAKDLLGEACRSKEGRIYWNHTTRGYYLKTNDREFFEPDKPREEARWKRALDDLIGAGLVEDRWHKGQVFALTARGYEVGDML